MCQSSRGSLAPAAPAFIFMGLQLSEMITGQIALPLTRALYPGLSALQGDTRRMRLAFLQGVGALGAFAMPAAVGFAFIAEDLTALLLGEKWTAVAPIIQNSGAGRRGAIAVLCDAILCCGAWSDPVGFLS